MSVPPNLPREVPPLWMLSGIALMLVLHLWLPVAHWLPQPWRHGGWLLVCGGTALMSISLLRFLRAGTGVRPFTPVATLVDGGAYRWTRNPMYLGMVAVLSGMALLLGSLSALLVPPLVWLLLDRRFVRREEQFLRQHLGGAYDDYCRRVRRWCGVRVSRRA